MAKSNRETNESELREGLVEKARLTAEKSRSREGRRTGARGAQTPR